MLGHVLVRPDGYVGYIRPWESLDYLIRFVGELKGEESRAELSIAFSKVHKKGKPWCITMY
jgi:hypothetical protein